MLPHSRSLPAASVKALARLAVSLHEPAPVRQDIDNTLEQAAFISLILLLHQSIHPSNPFLLLQATVGVVAIVQVYTFSLKMTSISTSNPLLISTDIPHSFLPIFFFSPPSQWWMLNSVMWRKKARQVPRDSCSPASNQMSPGRNSSPAHKTPIFPTVLTQSTCYRSSSDSFEKQYRPLLYQ